MMVDDFPSCLTTTKHIGNSKALLGNPIFAGYAEDRAHNCNLAPAGYDEVAGGDSQ